MKGLAAALAVLVGASAAGAGSVSVPVGGQRTISFSQPVAKLYIKDPEIVDASSSDKSHVVLSGRANGVTTVQAVDAAGDRIEMYRVVVGTVRHRSSAAPVAPAVSAITLQRGTERAVVICSPKRCSSPMRGASVSAAADAVAGVPAVSAAQPPPASAGAQPSSTP